ncbi:hypothetical protein [Paremcibacter congregatus]|uniref:hypothetical protein n=1 Tax=Paremcibacter congregatus TaxID=2043170 RepID=UPI001122390E|nr:hypothetical protein [Paremcibacter congregatus]QDE27262.1 hypothetical protein FIV45_08180 [Paremcibacter congregatus]
MSKKYWRDTVVKLKDRDCKAKTLTKIRVLLNSEAAKTYDGSLSGPLGHPNVEGLFLQVKEMVTE